MVPQEQKKRPADYAKVVVKAIALPCLYIIVIPIRVIIKTWEWKGKRHDRRKKARRSRELQKKCFQPKKHPHRISPTRGTGPLFTILPPEIRRRILVEAFGDQTIHLDFAYRRRPGSSTPAWIWFSCICHADMPGQHHWSRWQRGKTPCGYHGPPTEKIQRDPLHCPGLAQASAPHAGSCPDNCGVGATGWLLSCRQANIEGLEVLYGTNIIHLDSPVLLSRFHEIISPEKLCLMRSLEINMTQILDLSLYFGGDSDQLLPEEDESVLFPSLRQLRFLTPHQPCRRIFGNRTDEVCKLVGRLVLPETNVIVVHVDGQQYLVHHTNPQAVPGSNGWGPVADEES